MRVSGSLARKCIKISSTRLQIVFLKSSFRWFWQKLKFKNYSSNSSGNCVLHMLFPLNSIIQEQNLLLGLFGLLEESSSFWNYPQKPCQKRSRLSKLQKKKLKRLQRLQSAFCYLSACPMEKKEHFD